jgi:protein ImuB
MFAVVHIPDFYLQAALRHEPELDARPVALLSGKQNESEDRAIVLQCTSRARAAGVHSGLTSAQALARCAQLVFKTHSIAAESSATEILLQTIYAFSPHIELTANGVCTVDLRGLALQDDGARKDWAERIRSAFTQFHLRTTVGFAETPALALLAARETQSVLIADNSSDFVSTLPLPSLEPHPAISGILRRWGIHTVGELLALGKDAIAERLGAAALELFERVSPDCIRPLNIIKPSESFEEQTEFEVVIETTEPLLFVLRRFIEQLAARISLSYRVVAELHLHLTLESGAAYERTFKIPAPTSNVETLFRMLHTHLENLRADAPITALRLTAKPCRSENQQFGLFENALRDPNHFHETLARLTALLGAERVGTPVREITRQPDAFRMMAPEFYQEGSARALACSVPRLRGTQKSARNEDDLRAAESLIPTGEGASRHTRGRVCSPIAALCLRRFRPPIRAHVILEEKQPVALRSSKFAGAIHDSRGPFCSSGNWWDNTKWSRIEWDVQASDGTLYRIAEREGDWFVEGVYD